MSAVTIEDTRALVQNVLDNTENPERLTRDQLIHLIQVARILLGAIVKEEN